MILILSCQPPQSLSLNAFKTCLIPACLKCVLVCHGRRGSRARVAGPFHNSSLCLCMTAPRWPSISETIWHQRYCVSPNLRESAVHAAAPPARPRLSASAYLCRGSDFPKGVFERTFSGCIWCNAAGRGDACMLEPSEITVEMEMWKWWVGTKRGEEKAGRLKGRSPCLLGFM